MKGNQINTSDVLKRANKSLLKTDFGIFHPELQDCFSVYSQIDCMMVKHNNGTRNRYGYIPINLGGYIQCLLQLKKYTKVRSAKFLEIGCGYGRNLIIAKAAGYHNVHGIEINKSMVDIGKKQFGLEKEIVKADALKFDYSEYDIVYFYRPLCNKKLEYELESRVIEQIPIGGYIITMLALLQPCQPGSTLLTYNYDPRLQRKTEHIYQKVK